MQIKNNALFTTLVKTLTADRPVVARSRRARHTPPMAPVFFGVVLFQRGTVTNHCN